MDSAEEFWEALTRPYLRECDKYICNTCVHFTDPFNDLGPIPEPCDTQCDT